MRTIVLLVVLVASIAVRAERAALPELSVPGAMGVNIHFTDPKPGEMKMLADAGFKWVRMDFAWGGTEREKGKYDFAAYDRLLAALAPHGIRAYFILDYGNRLYDDGLSPHTEEGRAAMAGWAAAAVTHFTGKGVVWEMWNEPNIGFWKPKPSAEDYAKLALAVGKAVRAAGPDELLVGPATSTIDLAFIETCLKAGLLEYWDAVSVHPYRQGDPETVNAEYRKLRLLIARYAPAGKRVPILSGEWGYSSAWGQFDEARQAKYLPREMLVNLYNEVPVSIWYDWHEDGRDPKEAEHHFGTVRNEYKKDGGPVYEAKGAYVAMRTMSEQLGGFTYSKRLAMGGDDDYCLLFAWGDDDRLACWGTGPAHDVSLPVGEGKFDVVAGGTTMKVSAGPAGLAVTLTDTVAYVRPEAKSEFLRVAAACERVPLEILQPAGKLARRFSVRNPLDRPLKAAINGYDDVTVAAGGSADFEVGMSVGRSAAPKALAITTRLPGLGTFAQVTSAISSDPLDATLLPPVSDGGAANAKVPLAVVRVDNPSKRAIDVVVRVKTVKGLYWPEASKDVTIPAGADHAYVALEMGCAASASYAASLALLDRDDRVLLELPKRAYHNVLDVKQISAGKLGEHLTTVADGDRAVKSEEALTLGASPGEKEPNADYIPTPSLKLTYAFDAGWKFLQVKPATAELKKIEGKPKQLGLWVRGDDAGAQLRLRFTDSAGQTFQPGGVKVDFKGWRYVTIPMDGTEAGHWGKGDGRVHYPIAWDALLLVDNPSREKRAGELWFAGMTLVE